MNSKTLIQYRRGPERQRLARQSKHKNKATRGYALAGETWREIGVYQSDSCYSYLEVVADAHTQ